MSEQPDPSTLPQRVLEIFKGTRPHNYETLPTIDVEVLPNVRYCFTCGEQVVYEQHPRGAAWGSGAWRHASPDTPDHGYIAPTIRCRYCHSHDAVYRQHAWFDAVECPRCAGVDGHAIGD